MSFAKTQDFGLEPVEVRESDHYQEEYVTTLADKWDELIDWKRRAKAEGDFFIRTLKEHGAKKFWMWPPARVSIRCAF